MAMNFFERQAEMRTLTQRLVWMFLLAVLIVVIVVDSVLLTLIAVFMHPKGSMPTLPDAEWLAAHHGSVWLCTLLVVGVITVASLYKTGLLKGGGGVVARAAGGERVPNATNDPQLRLLLNVVEEIAIAASTPVPAMYVLPHETGINAFAAGFNASNAAITVTQGCLDLLNRAELQGVIAHEFSHIVNGDIRLNARLTGLLFGLIVVATIGRTLLRLIPSSGSSDRKNNNVVIVVFLAGAAIYAAGYIGLFLGRIIQATVARKRESLADASAVQFTRDATGLRGALVKIGAAASGSHLSGVEGDELAHMLFAPGMDRMFATHPPLIDRIKAIDPHFNSNEFATARSALLTTPHHVDVIESAPAAAQRLQQVLTTAVGINAATITQSVGQPTDGDLQLAQTIRCSLPQPIVDAAHSPRGALELMLALAVDSDASLREQEINFIAQQLGVDTAQRCRNWLGAVDQLNALQRQPVLLRLLPSLRQLASAERATILICLNGLLQRGGSLSPAKYALRKLAQVQLRDVASNVATPQRLSLAVVVNETAALIAVLARNGSDDPQQARAAYDAGMQFLYLRSAPTYQPPVDWSVQLDRALNQLDHLLPAAKEKLIEAMVRVVAFDNTLTASEVELLRVTCATLHCPLPSMLGADN